MAKVNEIYKCEICGNIVLVLHGGAGALVCCGEEMKLMEEKTKDSSVEKHVPFIEETESGIKVKIGENQAHPMEEKHYIEWIEIQCKCGKTIRKFLKPGDEPAADFPCKKDEVLTAREYCNVHGLWKN